MTNSNATPALTVRESRTNPGRYVVCQAETGTAVYHPYARVSQDEHAAVQSSLFDTEQAARRAVSAWPAQAEEVDRSAPRAPRPVSSQLPPAPRTLADDVRALKRYMAARDADPFHGWHPCNGTHCMCNPAPAAFRSAAHFKALDQLHLALREQNDPVVRVQRLAKRRPARSTRAHTVAVAAA